MDKRLNSRLNRRYQEQAYAGYRLGPKGYGERLTIEVLSSETRNVAEREWWHSEVARRKVKS